MILDSSCTLSRDSPNFCADYECSVSPSVYVVFSSLAASDLCGPVGKTYQGKTMAFGESELSTSLGTIADPFNVINYPPETYAWTAFNYGDLTIKYVHKSALE